MLTKTAVQHQHIKTLIILWDLNNTDWMNFLDQTLTEVTKWRFKSDYVNPFHSFHLNLYEFLLTQTLYFHIWKALLIMCIFKFTYSFKWFYVLIDILVNIVTLMNNPIEYCCRNPRKRIRFLLQKRVFLYSHIHNSLWACFMLTSWRK
jgi:hypothetical protein